MYYNVIPLVMLFLVTYSFPLSTQALLWPPLPLKKGSGRRLTLAQKVRDDDRLSSAYENMDDSQELPWSCHQDSQVVYPLFQSQAEALAQRKASCSKPVEKDTVILREPATKLAPFRPDLRPLFRDWLDLMSPTFHMPFLLWLKQNRSNIGSNEIMIYLMEAVAYQAMERYHHRKELKYIEVSTWDG